MKRSKASSEARGARRQAPSKPRDVGAAADHSRSDQASQARATPKLRKVPRTKYPNLAELRGTDSVPGNPHLRSLSGAELVARHRDHPEVLLFAEQFIEARGALALILPHGDRAEIDCANAMGAPDAHTFDLIRMLPALALLASKIHARPNRAAAAKPRSVTMEMAAILLQWERAKRDHVALQFSEHARRYAAKDEQGLGWKLPVFFEDEAGVERATGFVINGDGPKGLRPPSKSGQMAALKRYFAVSDMLTAEEIASGKLRAELQPDDRGDLNRIIRAGIEARMRADKEQSDVEALYSTGGD